MMGCTGWGRRMSHQKWNYSWVGLCGLSGPLFHFKCDIQGSDPEGKKPLENPLENPPETKF